VRAGEAHADEAGQLLDAAVEDKDILARRLIAVRMHHELTRLSREGYRDLLKKLAYTQPPAQPS